jgi:membrane associated rhomboid family serine protease
LIPYSDPSEPDHVFPYVNLGLIALNFIVFFYELSVGALGQSHLTSFINQYGLVPCEYTAHTPCKLAHVEPHPFYITALTSMFLHGGWLHILGNMLYLFVFGDNIENSMGHFRYLIFYVLCGFGANILEILTGVNSSLPGLGASGAIAGVLGAYLMLYPSSRVGTLIPITFILIPVRLPAWLLIGFWFVLQFFNGLVTVTSQNTDTGGIAYFAHVGGFLTGAILIWLFRHPERVGHMRDFHGRRT